VLQAFVAVACDDLDDFPLDSGGNDDVTDNDESPDTTTVEGEMSMSNLDMDDVPSDESV